MTADQNLSNPSALFDTLLELRHQVCTEGQELFQKWQPTITRRMFIPSALNLAYYLSLRRRDLRDIQDALMPWGLSSLGRLEARVLQNLDAVIVTLGTLCQKDRASLPRRPAPHQFARGERLLRRKTNIIFGNPPPERRVRIMVTMPSEAAQDYELVRDLLQRGMDCIRINCAHDNATVWAAMIANLRRAEQELNRPCKVSMDLAGPKIRVEAVVAPKDARLNVGDHFLLTMNEPHETAEFPVQAQCTIPEVFQQVQVGESVWYDDGKLGATVETTQPDGLVLHVTQCKTKGEKLRPEKGLNFPDTDLHLPALSQQDLIDLDFVAQNADIINYSFVQDAADVERLQDALKARLADFRRITIVAKIETQRAVENLPQIIVAAAGKQPLGVMIARGDLAVEIGFERMAEMQEEILWLCEAAHVPVIWATQVLEQLVKKGRPSRAEMSDAAMAERAECVMLNKGDYIGEGVSILDDVLRRMEAHQSKKTSRLRALQSWAG